jgi:hypothetical protein
MCFSASVNENEDTSSRRNSRRSFTSSIAPMRYTSSSSAGHSTPRRKHRAKDVSMPRGGLSSDINVSRDELFYVGHNELRIAIELRNKLFVEAANDRNPMHVPVKLEFKTIEQEQEEEEEMTSPMSETYFTPREEKYVLFDDCLLM